MTKTICKNCHGEGYVSASNGTDTFGNDVSHDEPCEDCRGTGRIIKMTWLESLQAKAAQK